MPAPVRPGFSIDGDGPDGKRAVRPFNQSPASTASQYVIPAIT